MNGPVSDWICERMNEFIQEKEKKKERINEWMHEWMNVWMDMNERITNLKWNKTNWYDLNRNDE